LFAVYKASGEAINRARRGEGASLLEARAFRYYGHYVGDTQTYKTEQEVESYKAQDPIVTFKKKVLEDHLISESELAKIDDKTNEAIEEAIRFAEESPYPAPEECLADIYASYKRREVEL
jgi:TPP-dependent pyruvate/acetoin dehydrogenase alpha subunit